MLSGLLIYKQNTNLMSIIQKVFLLFSSLSGALSVILGALGSHWLKDKVNYWQLGSFETAVKYQFYHTLAILFLVLLMNKMPSKLLNYAGFSFIAGILLFSGSLYLLSVKSLFGMEKLAALGPVTPVGGLAFIIGWLLIAFVVISNWK